jgi:uncharacterized protein
LPRSVLKLAFVVVPAPAVALALAVALVTFPARAAEPPPGAVEMTTYYVGFLYRGPQWTPGSTPESEKIQEGHMANIRRLAAEGKLLLAGPFTDDGDLRGMFVFTVASLEEARALAETDPAVKAGRLRIELHPWFSAKGIKVDLHPIEPKAP